MVQIVTLFREISNENFKYILNEKYTMAFSRYELLHNTDRRLNYPLILVYAMCAQLITKNDFGFHIVL